jgi:hypothetical protein
MCCGKRRRPHRQRCRRVQPGAAPVSNARPHRCQRDRGIPMIVNVNLRCPCEDAGLEVDAGRLREVLGLPVILTSAATGEGWSSLPTPSSKPSLRTGDKTLVGLRSRPDFRTCSGGQPTCKRCPAAGSASENTGSALQSVGGRRACSGSSRAPQRSRALLPAAVGICGARRGF